MRRFHQAEPVAWSASSLGVGGYTFDGVPSVATLAVATTRPASTRRRMPTRQVTLSYAVSNQARNGFGITGPTTTWKGLAWHRRSTIRRTSLCLDQPDGSPPTGKTSWWNRDDALGRHRRGPRTRSMRPGLLPIYATPSKIVSSSDSTSARASIDAERVVAVRGRNSVMTRANVTRAISA
jgi:hypothetical protein